MRLSRHFVTFYVTVYILGHFLLGCGFQTEKGSPFIELPEPSSSGENEAEEVDPEAVLLFSANPNLGVPNTLVTLEGQNLNANSGRETLTFAGVPATFVSEITGESISVRVPNLQQLPNDPVDVVFNRGDGKTTILSAAFQYAAIETCSYSFSIDNHPTEVSAGLAMTVTGEGFQEGLNSNLGSSVAETEFKSSTTIAITVPDLDRYCKDSSGCLFTLQVQNADGCNMTSDVDITYFPTSEDDDKDGVPNDFDCAPQDANRYPGAPDTLDGVDTNCKWDSVECETPDNPDNEDAHFCDDFDLGIHLGASNGFSAYCVKVDLIPGQGKDPFVNASIEMEIKRQKNATSSSGWEPFFHYSYWIPNANPRCGPPAAVSNFIESDYHTLDAGEDSTICDFDIPSAPANARDNYTRITTSGARGLKHLVEIRHSNFQWTWPDPFYRSCEFGD